MQILFVDYGNVETCDSCDLRVAEILEHIPIQANKFYLAYVQPVGNKGVWDQKILEFIHVHIVNKTVSVRVQDNIDHEIVPCTLTIGVMDLIKTLVYENLAEYSPTLNVNLNRHETYSFYSPQKSSEKTNRDIDKYKEPSIPLSEFKKEIEKKKEASKVKRRLNEFEPDLTPDFIVEDSDADALSNSFCRDSSDFDRDFQPHDSSTTISTAMKTFSLLPFKQMKLNDRLTRFTCNVYEVLDTLHLFVEPIIEEYTANFNRMESAVKNSRHKNSRDFNVSTARCCLAPYSSDNCYYRAVINDRINKTTARIRFVDYLNEEVVECKQLRECPADVVEQPLKNLLVKLHGIKPSRWLRDSDIKRQLESLNDKSAVAVVVTNDAIPSVRLYDSNNPAVLLYQSLIDSKFYTETKD